ncbi:hypothetical protein BDP81DRAFT_120824 [Colletotrichum phormii]|uniref:Uncharacterized protein n=1 Tax=Colletotrichum phormii TaxID=359342 RepID=A0AAI9ZF11_9PEZI|nr:uncharacterized protein BDP81DRAFT_120824 [Colletotrichum phormii]KAK1623344.1 hypothetical protein BDP81DRAFT_120824 [Colletotrichum phormii]
MHANCISLRPATASPNSATTPTSTCNPSLATLLNRHLQVSLNHVQFATTRSWPTKPVRDIRYRPLLATPNRRIKDRTGVKKATRFAPIARIAPHRSATSTRRLEKQTRPTSPTSLLHRLSAPALLSHTHIRSTLSHSLSLSRTRTRTPRTRRDPYSSSPSACSKPKQNTLRGLLDHHKGGKY